MLKLIWIYWNQLDIADLIWYIEVQIWNWEQFQIILKLLLLLQKLLQNIDIKWILQKQYFSYWYWYQYCKLNFKILMHVACSSAQAIFGHMGQIWRKCVFFGQKWLFLTIILSKWAHFCPNLPPGLCNHIIIEINIEKYCNILRLNWHGYCRMKNWKIDVGIDIENFNNKY